MFDLFVYDLARVRPLELRIDALSETVRLQGVRMSKADDAVADLNARFDAATTEIAADLAALRQAIADNTVTPAQLAKLDTNVSRLEGMGQDPDDPTVDEPPVDTPPTTPPTDEPPA